ncbi:putative lipid-transfer protein DIR1 [Carex littledalei]|uniref:Putative lipid-transfer protein DIR1 n=1 Tax=Carex littledalei TaxID=544730 RepID=A0A833VVN9_9POAL|nr:putative lipid-transfer protein DIR1 [Carex littledalei]
MVAFLLVLEGVHGICNVSNDGLMACKPAIQNDNPVDQPSVDCCAALKDANFKCLCQYKDSYMLKTMDINSTRAMELPHMCKTATAPIDCTSARHG